MSAADETDVVVTHEKSYAAGIPAVLVSLRRGLEQMGALRTARTLLKLNQRNGFDRPGCAWPETPGHRKHAEFCENGAKAVAEEATTRIASPSFFAAHPVNELLDRTDYWLGQQGPSSSTRTAPASTSTPPTSETSIWTPLLKRQGCRSGRSLRRHRHCWRPSGRSSAGRWDSPSTRTRSPTFKRS